MLLVGSRLWALSGKGIKDDASVKVFPDGKVTEQYSILNLFLIVTKPALQKVHRNESNKKWINLEQLL